MGRIGLFLCECGPNIAEAIDLDHIAQAIEKDAAVSKIERHKLLCSEEGKKFLATSLAANKFDRIVIAACSPKQHETTFMDVLSNHKMNQYLMQMVNIREQCAWVTPDKKAATEKALTSIRAAIHRVKYHEELEKKEIECNPAAIIIGGGIAGIEAALRTAHSNRQVYLLTEDTLGGTIKDQRLLAPTMQSAQELLEKKLEALEKNDHIEIYEHCTIDEILGFFGNFVARVRTSDNKPHSLKAGAIVLALDGQPYVPVATDNLGYGTIDDVYTAAEFEAQLSENVVTKSMVAPNTVAIIHCSGREQLGYCSKMCCVNSMKIAQIFKKHLGNIKITQFYKDLCIPDARSETYYKETKTQGIVFVRYQDISVTRDQNHLAVRVKSPDEDKTYPVDMVILSTGSIPSPQVKRFSQMFNIPLDEYGFCKEEHTILEPISTVTEGVYIISGMYGPGNLYDSVSQAGAAAGKILSSLVPGKRLVLEAKTSTVSETMCMGCGICVEVCAYGAAQLDETKRISIVNEVLCRGCGNCAAACPSGAALHRHFTNRQIFQEMNQILK
ncbi:CoB--CoM heterodisulfide reductase iron-sulfur subunit A family protein [candidate division WOR-3 bacterium]|nr:CoB--CoM heterodisulfide reductase iron-sulfur subunit A family protein [candidate division WOR-3 bacterium]